MRISIAQKLNIIFSLFIIFLTLVIFFLAYRTFASQLSQQIENRLTTNVVYTMEMIDQNLFTRVSDIELLTSEKNTALVNDEETINNENIKDEIEYLRNVEKVRKMYASMSIYDTKGIKMGDTRGLLIGTDESNKPFFEAAIKGDIHWDNEPVMSQSLGFPVIHFSGPLKDIHGNIKGVLVARFPIGKLHDILRTTMGKEDFEDFTVDLLNHDGLILFSNHTQEGVLKKKFNNFNMIRGVINDGNKDIASFTAQDNSEQRLFIAAKQKGYLDFKGNNWILVVSVKSGLLFRSVNDVIRIFFFIGLLIVMTIIPLSIFLSRVISRPLVVLAKTMNDIGKGDLNKKIDIKTNDEIGELSQTFNAMIKDLKSVMASRDELDEARINAQRAEKEIRLIQTISSEIYKADNFYSAFKIVLKEICEAVDGVWAEAWIPSPDGKNMGFLLAWSKDVETLKIVETESKFIKFALGEGLPGRIWSSLQGVWIQDLISDKNFVRMNLVKRVGVKAVLGVPIVENKEVIAIVNFFFQDSKQQQQQQQQQEKERLFKFVSTITNQLGSVVKRKQAEEERKKADIQIKKQALEARLLYEITKMAGSTDSLTEALQGCVDTICQLTSWPVGHIYVPSEDGSQLVSSKIWFIKQGEEEGISDFRKVTEETTFVKGIGLPGRIWATGEPAWIRNVQGDDNFPRCNKCKEIKIKGAFGFPIKVKDETVAVAEFFTKEEMELDENLLDRKSTRLNSSHSAKSRMPSSA